MKDKTTAELELEESKRKLELAESKCDTLDSMLLSKVGGNVDVEKLLNQGRKNLELQSKIENLEKELDTTRKNEKKLTTQVVKSNSMLFDDSQQQNKLHNNKHKSKLNREEEDNINIKTKLH